MKSIARLLTRRKAPRTAREQQESLSGRVAENVADEVDDLDRRREIWHKLVVESHAVATE